MAGTPSSFLERRRTELMNDERSVPLAYDELKEQARDHLPQGPYDYVAGGAGSEGTIRENRAVFDRYRVVTRVLQDVSERELGTELFGRDVAAPLVLAPIGGQTKYHEEGELATARAASELGITMAVSNNAAHSLEEIAEASGDGPRLFQLYWPNDWDVAASLVQRAEDSGYDGIVLTVDSKLPKWRRRNLENAYRGSRDARNAIYESDPVVQELAEEAGQPPREFALQDPAVDDDPSITWDDLDRLREWTDLPVVLKGILSVDDAKTAAEWGAEGIVVSNHGGRQIDGEVGALDQLPAIADAVGDRTTVVLDSGVRSGSDAFTALALGADAVQFGRPYIFGLAIAGQDGVEETVLNYLAELESVMGLSGYPSIEEIDREAIVERENAVTNLGLDAE